MKRLSRILAGSLMLAILLFSAIRIAYDLTLGEDYWGIHTRAFILAELSLTWAYSIAAVLLAPVLIGLARRPGLSPVAEYGAVVLFAAACALSVILISHSIDPGGSLAVQLVIPLTVSVLLSCLYYSYRRTAERDRELAVQAMILEKTRSARLDAELQLLRAQYHPHFLFNMLNTIYMQTDEENEAPRHTIECLSEVLRYQLYSPDEPVDVSLETEAMEKYIELCRLRAPRELKLETGIEAPHGDILIYPLLLIPLVENAFKHLGGEPMVSIRFGPAADGMLELQVSNSVSTRLQAKAKSPSGLGIANLRRRLGLLYPEGAHSLEFSETPDRFTATLRLKPISPHSL